MNKKKIKEFLLLTFSTLLIAVGIYFFKFPNNFTFGGVTGLAVLVAKTGLINASDFTFIINMVLLLMGFLVFGRKFGIKTTYTSILLSLSLSLLERIYPMNAPFTDEPMLELCFAIALPALGSAILFNIGASSGGTDIIAMVLKKYTNVNIGKGLLLSDLLITAAGCFVFDIKTGLFSFLGLTIKSFMVDGVIESINLCKYFNVVCNKPEPICDYIVHELNRSATVCEAKGAFTGKHKYIVFTVMGRHEAVLLRTYIRQIDPDAFILISSTSEIVGKGFHSI
ncbi:YitT family protein [Diplocloster agilis]|uniref:YitT family protein n=1 Tax=Diplocloster agilis TaxID=2850323 RepID=A0A949NFA4_9FIRM|nr:YitT family protein [Diplocloster agilis]MBU9738166.1 YitT family protein [Diplocloster agilis]MBU9743729.1 YitT family protein [Diplocloster agilis]